MLLTGWTTLLLFLGVITPGYTADPTECTFPNNTATSSNFSLDVSPGTLYNNTVYTVNVTGSGNVIVLLQSISNNSLVGTWSSTATVNCAGGPLFKYNFDEKNSLVANWTSPSSPIPDSVNISVSITNGTVSYNIAKTLNADSTNTGSSNHPISLYLSIVQTLGLLMITSKLL